jgi:hypothetical protein
VTVGVFTLLVPIHKAGTCEKKSISIEVAVARAVAVAVARVVARAVARVVGRAVARAVARVRAMRQGQWQG